MANYPVRFEFYCGEEELKYIHNIPRSLVTVGAQAARDDAGYVDLFANTMQLIIKEHEAACLVSSKALCENCSSPRVTTLQTPMSWLHRVGDPFVAVWVHPVCGKGGCEIQIRQEVQNMMSELVGEVPGQRVSEPRTSSEVILCKVCGKTDAIKRCGRCMVVGYCGKEHQKADWQVHRTVCVPKAGKAVEKGSSLK